MFVVATVFPNAFLVGGDNPEIPLSRPESFSVATTLVKPLSPDRLLTRLFYLLGRGSLTDPLLSNNSIYSAEGPLATRVFPERELKLATRARPTRPTSDPRVGYTFTWQSIQKSQTQLHLTFL